MVFTVFFYAIPNEIGAENYPSNSNGMTDSPSYATKPSAIGHYNTHWRNTLHFLPRDSADYIGLPYPYTTPTLRGNTLFAEMYYWDSYFINLGLLTSADSSQLIQAINNCNNLIYLVNRFGFVPNANRFSMCNRSQPPLLSEMVMDIFCRTKDTNWLRSALDAVAKEHYWWMENRFTTMLPLRFSKISGSHKPVHPSVHLILDDRMHAVHEKNEHIAQDLLGSNPLKKTTQTDRIVKARLSLQYGLNHYGQNADEVYLQRFSRFLKQRLGTEFDSLLKQETKDSVFRAQGERQSKGQTLCKHMLAEAESGWDFTPRFDARCESIAALDLNCLLYMGELTLARGYAILGEKYISKAWKKTALQRKKTMNKTLYDKSTGLYWDFDLLNNKKTFVLGAAQFMPYFTKLAKQNRKSTLALLFLCDTLITRFGVIPCLPVSNRVVWKTQWNSPNAWPCLTHFAAAGIYNYSHNYSLFNSCMIPSRPIFRRSPLGLVPADEEEQTLDPKLWGPISKIRPEYTRLFCSARQTLLESFLGSVENQYNQNGKFWEKYNLNSGNLNVQNEYEMPEFMGWTAGLYMYYKR